MEKARELRAEIIAALNVLPLESLKLLAEFATFLRDRMASAKADKASLEQQLAQDYETLAMMYTELADETSDELWLPLENEALACAGGAM